jgi:hypothetical protein
MIFLFCFLLLLNCLSCIPLCTWLHFAFLMILLLLIKIFFKTVDCSENSALSLSLSLCTYSLYLSICTYMHICVNINVFKILNALLCFIIISLSLSICTYSIYQSIYTYMHICVKINVFKILNALLCFIIQRHV